MTQQQLGLEALATVARLLGNERPLVSLDLETTGSVVRLDRIVQVAVLKAYPDGRTSAWSTLVDPQMLVPAEATQVHKIANADLEGAPTFKDIASKLVAGLLDVDVVGYNVRDFDLPFLAAEFERVGVAWAWEALRVVDAQKIFFQKEPRSLTAALKFFLNETLEDAHDAYADAAAAARVLAAQLDLYPDLPRDVDALSAACFPRQESWVDRKGKVVWRGGEACLNFGKWRGTPLRRIPKDYLAWMTRDQSFDAEIREIVGAACDGRFPVRGA